LQGLVATDISRGVWWIPSFKRFAGRFVTSADDCAEYLFSAFSKPEHRTGFYSIDTNGDTLSGIPKASPDQASKVLKHLDATLGY
jgi:hypothetical protein